MNIMAKFNHSHHLLSSKHGTNRLWNANCINSWNARQKTMTWQGFGVSIQTQRDWLHAIPISSSSICLNDEAIRIAVGLRLGVDICEPHTCVYGAMVDVRGSHALSCKRSFGRLILHNHLKDIIRRSLTRADIPATKEPAGLMRTDGKRPGGLTLIPWRKGRCLIWNATVADTTAASYLP